MMFKEKDIDIKQLFHLMKEHDISDFTLKDGKTEIMIKRNGHSHTDSPQPPVLETSNPVPAVTDKQADEPAKENPELQPNKTPPDNLHPIKAPLVGTFYRSPSPETDAFVEVGDSFAPGDVLCIVEAMKSMNEIQAETSGIIKEICIENGQLVEYDQVMFKIDRSG
ncbi:MAG: acetyl-CoA carboxylase biotin carboxyl carrier protein [bacterium]|nr:acetyl-CoA carboxylase biotin carboxyl carrier protein [bacterium]